MHSPAVFLTVYDAVLNNNKEGKGREGKRGEKEGRDKDALHGSTEDEDGGLLEVHFP